MAAIAWSCHDHGKTWSWSCHDNRMAAMFLNMVVMIHGMIMLWSSCFACVCSKQINCLSFFSQIVGIMYHFMALLIGFRRIYSTKVARKQNWAKNSPEIWEFFFLWFWNNKFYLNCSFNITYILQLFVIFGKIETLRERSILVNVILVISDGFVQPIPH